MSGRYRTLFTGMLVQDSGLSTGGRDPELSLVDSPLARDGKDRFVLRGESIAGALVATLRKLVDAVPADISGCADNTSRWQFFASHPEKDKEGKYPIPEFRSHVGIRQDTGASAEGLLFDTETLPRGTRWKLLLEVNTWGGGGEVAEILAAAALLEWTRGRCFIGREVARGLGWCTLEDLMMRRLDTSYSLQWPDSSEEPHNVVTRLDTSAQPVSADHFVHDFGSAPPVSTDWCYLELDGLISAGERSDLYGLDALFIGGHAVGERFVWDVKHFLTPEGREPNCIGASFAPEAVPAMTRGTDGTFEPFIPGSSLRGPLRHALSRALRQKGGTVRDPNAEQEKEDPKDFDDVDHLFGTTKRSARLLIRDAYLSEEENWEAAWLQHHAEDEFAGSVYRSGKFDRVVITKGRFAWRMVLEIEASEWRARENQIETVLKAMRQLGKSRRLPIGGAKWRSAGWPEWTIAEPCFAFAGEAGKPAGNNDVGR